MIDINVSGYSIQLRTIYSLYDDFDTMEAWDVTGDRDGYKLFELRKYEQKIYLAYLDEVVDISIVEEVIHLAKTEF